LSTSTITNLQQVIKARCTTKVLSDTNFETQDLRTELESIIAMGGWAPFHKVASKTHLEGENSLPGIEPWRIHALDSQSCRQLRAKLLELGDDSKVPQMLASALALFQITWLPNPAHGDLAEKHLFEPTLENMEHIAAASCAAQNMLLSATALGYDNFWSTGRWLRGDQVFEWLKIPQQEILLGALFIFPSQLSEIEVNQSKIVKSKLRERRGEPKSWSRWVEL
jgi:nitroreductase